ncbi:DMT family transporter [Acinetobacter sp. A3.8]|uniref:DMT family transporter n=1 Tax=Acinetobacter sedimenti TaxID=2919922 RepID=A0A9X2B9L3_9GAMM|nr:DMT family transporter [Acinetobacter sedimenti]MCJ8145705.1 DMT family transporter [Acinetobacter sedimenti]
MRVTEMLIPLFFAAGVGLAMATQTAVNSQLRQYLNSPIQAAFFSFLVGTICLAIMMLVMMWNGSALKPTLSQLNEIPVWLWVGGLLGVYAVTASIYTAPKLGFLTFTGLVLFGQVIMSMLLDHFGLIGVEKNPVNWQRLLGAILIAIGIIFTLQR